MVTKFNDRLKYLRNERELTQKELAEKIELTQRKISYLETGRIEPDLSTLLKISNFFGVSCDYLIGKTDY